MNLSRVTPAATVLPERSSHALDPPPIVKRRRLAIIGFFVLLFIIDSFLYFRHANHFFQGDTIFLLNHRATSVTEYLKEFIHPNPSGWYRPLANELVESVLFPIVGLAPLPYRIPVYTLFFVLTIAVYALALAVSGRRFTAALTAFFFTIHTTNAYTTYDIGFLPELQFALFYVLATLAFLRYLRSGSQRAKWLSLVCFVLSLLSKEAAASLPATLFAAGVIFGSDAASFLKRLQGAAAKTAWHMLILAVYVTTAVF
jgi:hypothetical protein